MEQLCALADICAAIARNDRRWNQQTVRKDGRLIGFAVTVGIFKDQDLVFLFLAWCDLWIDRRTGNPQAALRIEVHLDRLGQKWVFCPEADLDIRIGLEFDRRLWTEW